MADISQFVRIYDEDELSVTQRVFSSVDGDIDTRPGEIFHDLVMPIVQEMASMWDSVNNAAAVTFLPWSYGVYLDYKGNYEIGLSRRSASTAVVDLTFVGEQGALVPAGFQVSTIGAGDEEDIIFNVAAGNSGVIGMSIPNNTGYELTVTTAPGTVMNTPNSKVWYFYTYVGRGGETRNSPIVEIAHGTEGVLISDISTGPTGTLQRKLYRSESWDPTTGNLERDFRLIKTIDNNIETQFTDDKDSDPDTEPISDPNAPTDYVDSNTTDRVVLSAVSLLPGSTQNVPSQSLTYIPTRREGITSVFNQYGATGGTDVEDDDAYRNRLIDAVSMWQGQGNKDDYLRWSLLNENIDNAVVLNASEIEEHRLFPGDEAARVHVVLIGPDNTVPANSTVMEVQEFIAPDGINEDGTINPDPIGSGTGAAPIGAKVTITAAAAVEVTIVVEQIEYEQGWSADGLTEVGDPNDMGRARDGIQSKLDKYFRELPGDGDVVWSEVLAAIVTAPGVANVPFDKMYLTKDGATLPVGDNVPVGVLELAQLISVDLPAETNVT